MNKYLIDLLNELNTIIIPNFGALTVVNRARKEFMFMPYLKFDDKQLSNYIAQRENWTLVAAEDLIGKYVHDIKITIDKGGVYTFKEIGSFSKNSEGEIVFANWDEQKNVFVTPVNTTSIAQEMVETVVEVPEVSEPIIEEVKLSEPEIIEEGEKTEVEQIETPILPEIEVEETNVLNEEVTLPKEENITSEPEKTEVEMVSEEEQWKDDLDLPPLNYVPPVKKKPILEKTQKDKKPRSKRNVLLTVFALFFIVGLGLSGFYWEQIKSLVTTQSTVLLDSEDEVDEQIEVPEMDAEEIEEEIKEAIEDTYLETQPVQTNTEPIKEIERKVDAKVETQKIVANTSGKVNKSLPYQAIAGSFGEEANAHKLIAILQAKGVEAAIIGVVNNMHLVSMASFTTADEYTAKKAQLTEAGPHWLFHKK